MGDQWRSGELAARLGDLAQRAEQRSAAREQRLEDQTARPLGQRALVVLARKHPECERRIPDRRHAELAAALDLATLERQLREQRELHLWKEGHAPW